MKVKQVDSQSTCAVCRSKGQMHRFWATDRNMRTTEELFEVVECPSCGIYQTLPHLSPEEAKKYYPAPYYPNLETSLQYYNTTSRYLQADKTKILKRFRSSGKLLDVGCGVGYFVHEARGADFDAEGLEFSPEAASVGQKLWNLKIHAGDFLLAEYAPESFDVVTLWQVFEHFSQPVETLRKIRQILKPGGLLVIAVPNIASIQASVFGSRWYHLEVPRHAFHYSPATLGALLEQEGFQVKGVDHTSREHNGAGIYGSVIRLWIQDESLLHKVIRKTVARVLGDGLAAVESACKRGGTVTLIAEKK